MSRKLVANKTIVETEESVTKVLGDYTPDHEFKTQAEYDALPASKESDGKLYLIEEE